jgi:hypothetical protein
MHDDTARCGFTKLPFLPLFLAPSVHTKPPTTDHHPRPTTRKKEGENVRAPRNGEGRKGRKEGRKEGREEER